MLRSENRDEINAALYALATAKISEVAALDPHLFHIKAFDLPPQEKKLVLDTEGIVALGEQLAKSWLKTP